ncbi:NADH:flavin oxidoreductase/NADH oxidase [Conexibacter stalactiti]|uniref:NADH:flavin oxidoreductase/NADH oxidase n=1 Tax=Conexibacter stalactiti TaxID=1940611 RepID=A0ABU4HXH5_9ACTN|nr:NADH:flavin oxidoreductase/NADH oxidase [Conexibacter stalactiti]MDW5597928.1 NADH:flavin oxidoreductase/NADH oxidase [Conexibacter stalactiti]MEC5038570.1 NADH:flavin oxidoreductase/NADH oxidase [Conexibacter stalactiti]
MAAPPTPAQLFSPLRLRELTLRNRLVVSPMCQYSATDGLPNDFHLVHLGRFALGGFGLVVLESTAVVPEGRITPGDLGIWSDEHVAPLARIAQFLKAHGAAAGIQLGHAGPKASTQRPWQGFGPLGAEDAARGEAAWPTVSASAQAAVAGWPEPAALSRDEIAGVVDAFSAAAARALRAGFDTIELHCAHGYLLNAFLSPLANRREDEYGGDLAGRMRLPLEIARRLRAEWPAELPLFVRLSAVDGELTGTTVEDTVAFARELAAVGVDVVDCSSGGVGARYAHPEHYGYQVPYAARVRAEAGIKTMAVGLVVDPAHAEAIVADGEADLVALGRTALDDPQWPLHAQEALGAQPDGDAFADWPAQARWALERRGGLLERLGPWGAAEADGDEQPE